MSDDKPTVYNVTDNADRMEVRQVLLDVIQLCADQEVDTVPYITVPKKREVMQNRAIGIAKDKIFKKLKDFIHVEIVTKYDGRQIVDAIFYLPYTYDYAMKKKDRDILFEQNRLQFCQVEKQLLETKLDSYVSAVVKFNALPWYKRIFKKVAP